MGLRCLRGSVEHVVGCIYGTYNASASACSACSVTTVTGGSFMFWVDLLVLTCAPESGML